MPITRYRKMLEQALNLMAGYRQSEFSLLTVEDKELELRKDVEAFREFERLNKENNI